MNSLKKIFFLFVITALALCSAAAVSADGQVRQIVLSNDKATLDGQAVTEYDYAWHADPSTVHDEVKDAPAEYFTGTKPTGDDAVYVAHDIFYYPQVPAEGYKQVFYDGEPELAYYYPVSEYSEYIWATLPSSPDQTQVPTVMMHSEEEAWKNPVLHITQPGTYELSGTWLGQIWIDLGDQDDTFTDENAKVTLILNGVSVNCTVAPALVFYSVYEADNTWEERGSYGPDVDISGAGAHVVIADDSENSFSGTNVFRMLKTKYKNEDSAEAVKTQKKMRKLDGAFYSYQSMLIEGQEKGNGVLNIIAGFEGLDSELHLTLNSGKVNIQSQDDGMNVNEDDVSVLTVNGGELHIVAGLGNEGDGIDSNGYVTVNGGVLISRAKPFSDSGLDSEHGAFVNGGYVVATGSTMDWAEADSKQPTMNLQFAADQAADEAIIVTTTDGKVIFAYDPDKDETTGANNRGYRGAVISSPEFKVGETYYVYIGGDVEGNEVDGLYDISTVTGFSGAARQIYTGTGLPGFGPGGMGGPGEPTSDEQNGRGGSNTGGPGDPMELLNGIEGITINQDKVSMTTEAATQILERIKKMNSQITLTAEQIAAATTLEELFEICGPGGGNSGSNNSGSMGGPGGMMGGPGGMMGGPGGMMGGPGGMMGGPGGMMGGPGGMMGGPGGMMGGPNSGSMDAPGSNENDGTPSTDFLMEDTVNAFSGVADETN